MLYLLSITAMHHGTVKLTGLLQFFNTHIFEKTSIRKMSLILRKSVTV
jgi:hypothetical protein